MTITIGAQDLRKATAAGPMRCNPGSGGVGQRMYHSHLFGCSHVCVRCGVSKPALARLKARAKSGRADAAGAMHFVLIKSADQDARTGARVGAAGAARRLLDARFWPLWEHISGRVLVDSGDRVCVYLGGAGTVIARARVAAVRPWSRVHATTYPLVLGGVPALVLELDDVVIFDRPVAVAPQVDRLDCVGENKAKWGMSFCGGMRSLTVRDYGLLTSSGAER